MCSSCRYRDSSTYADPQMFVNNFLNTQTCDDEYGAAVNESVGDLSAGKHQCVVNLSTNPQTACFGSSESSREDARVAAALNALHHCRIMTTRTNM